MKKYWERQLDSMISENRLERESVADLGVVYAEETGDISLIALQPICFLHQCYYQSGVLNQWSDSYSSRHMRNASYASSHGDLLCESYSGFSPLTSANGSLSWSSFEPASFSLSWSSEHAS